MTLARCDVVMLIALGGLPGVGKSALAVALAQRIGAVHIRIDTIEQAMRNVGFTVSGPEGYLAARDLARDNLRVGRTVIVDSVNPWEITRNYWRETAARMKVEIVEIEVVCSDRFEHRRRVESRVADIPGHDRRRGRLALSPQRGGLGLAGRHRLLRLP